MTRPLMLAVMAAACAPAPGDVLVGSIDDGGAVDRAGPPLPQTMTLRITDPLSPGWPVSIEVEGAPPNARLTLVRSTGTVGAGLCPRVLAGGCLGITQGGGYQTVPMQADAQGRAMLALTMPRGLPYDSALAFQVVDTVARAASNPLARSVRYPTCADDNLEDNDTLATASAGPASAAARSCALDDDIYAYALAPGESLTLTIDFDHAGDGDVDVLLRDANGVTLDSSRGTTDQEVVTWANYTYAPAEVYAQIYTFTDALTGTPADNAAPSGVAYTVTAARSQQGTCPADAYEPDDVAADATVVTPGRVTGLTACQADEWDWFKLQLPAGAKLTVTALHAVADGDIDVYLLDQPLPTDLRQLNQNNLARAFSTQDDDWLSYDIARTGTYWLAVHLYEDRPGPTPFGNVYELDVAVQ